MTYVTPENRTLKNGFMGFRVGLGVEKSIMNSNNQMTNNEEEEEHESCDCCHYVFEKDCKRKYYTETGTFCKACLEKQPCEDDEDE